MKTRNIYRSILLSMGLLIFGLVSVPHVFADGISYGSESSSSCIPVYGGGVSCPRVGQVLLDKKVHNPATKFFVDNLGPNDPKYQPQTVVTFQITVKNPGDETLDKVTVVDTLPKYLDFMSGPGSYDGNTGKVTWEVNNLAGGDSQVFEIKGRVTHPAKLPEGMTMICPTNDSPHPINIVDANASNGQSDHDEARYCIEREVPVTTVPKAGPEAWLITIPGLITTLGIGLKLRRNK